MGILIFLTATTYNDKTFAHHVPNGWYKSLRRFTLKVIYGLDLAKDYEDLPFLQEKDVYLIQDFVDNRYKSSGLKCLNFVQKSIQATSLADIATVDSHQISH